MKSIAQKFVFANSDEELQKFLEGSLADTLKQSLRLTVKILVKQEMEVFRKEFEQEFENQNKLYFNGCYDRHMVSTLGRIEGIEIPRFRQTPENLKLNSLNIFTEQKDQFVNLVSEMHLLGISQRKIDKLCRRVLGQKFPANAVGQVYKELAEREELNINGQKLDDDFTKIIVDGLWEKVKNYGFKPKNKSVLLCVLGLRADGSRKVIGFKLSDQEDFFSWQAVLLNLKERGLKGENLELIITDDNQALHKAASQIYPKVKIQNCIVHKMRNTLNKTSYKNRAGLALDLKKVFQSESKDEAMNESKSFCKKWFTREEKAIRSFTFNLELCLTYFEFPKELWTKIRTTNILEREFREVRRRTKVFDNSFNSNESANRYANTIFHYLNNNYPAKVIHTGS